MGMGNVSTQDFVNALAASIVDKVGPAQPYGKEKSEDQRHLEEQLRKMSKLTEGMEELTQTLKKIQQLAEQSKRNIGSQQGGDFSNLSQAINKLAGGAGTRNARRENTTLEETVFSKLARMADESVRGHSLHVEDYHVARRLDTLIGHVRDITAVLTRRMHEEEAAVEQAVVVVGSKLAACVK